MRNSKSFAICLVAACLLFSKQNALTAQVIVESDREETVDTTVNPFASVGIDLLIQEKNAQSGKGDSKSLKAKVVVDPKVINPKVINPKVINPKVINPSAVDPKVQEYRFRSDAPFQTYRIHQVIQQEVKRLKGTQIRAVPSIQRHIQVDNTIQAIDLEGTRQAAQRSKRPGHIVLEMKTVGDEQEDVAVGMFAPGSWIKSNDGIVHLYTEHLDVPKPDSNRFWIGVRCREVSSTPIHKTDLVVDEVVANSSAAKAGIRVKDQLVCWNETPLHDIDTLVSTIQKNGNHAASVQIRRDGTELELEITPQSRTVVAPVRTFIAPATRLNIAEKRIEELRKLIKLKEGATSQQVRLLLVGPAVNFGKEEIELQIKRDIQQQKESLKELLSNVANKKLGMIVDGDSFTFKKAPDVSASNLFNFEPHEIWENMEIGTEGKKISFSTLAPRMIQKADVKFEFKSDDAREFELPHTVHQLKAGQIVFPNPLGSIELKIRKEIDHLKGENDRIRSENKELKEQIIKLRDKLKLQK